MDKYIKALNLAKAGTLQGWASLLRGVLEQTPHRYKDLAYKVGLFIGEMEAMSKEWRDSIPPHPPEERN